LYYVLRRLPLMNEKGEALIEVHNTFRLGRIRLWKNGQAIAPELQDFPKPIQIEFDAFRGYEGPPVELLDSGIPLMSVRLADAVIEAGVDNVQFFPAILRCKQTGRDYEFRAYNVVGLVAAADLGKSEHRVNDEKPIGDVAFDTLELDDKKLRGQLFFRLAENFNAILVHEKVRRTIIGKGIDTIEFVKPEDWMHL
jgi:hypothetical protein